MTANRDFTVLEVRVLMNTERTYEIALTIKNEVFFVPMRSREHAIAFALGMRELLQRNSAVSEVHTYGATTI